MTKSALVLIVALLPACTTGLWAQSDTVMDTLLAEKSASFGEAVYLVMTAMNAVPDTASVEDAVTAAGQQSWRLPKADAASPITLGQYSFLLMQAFHVRGGLMYSLFPGPRYAARELAFRKLIAGDASPYRAVSGTEAVQILGSLLEKEGGGS